MVTTDWLLFADLVSEMGRLIEAGEADGPDFTRILREADALLRAGETLSDDLDAAFPDPHPWSILEGLGDGCLVSLDAAR